MTFANDGTSNHIYNIKAFAWGIEKKKNVIKYKKCLYEYKKKKLLLNIKNNYEL